MSPLEAVFGTDNLVSFPFTRLAKSKEKLHLNDTLINSQAQEMTQCLRSLDWIKLDTGSVPSTHMEAHKNSVTPVQGDPVSFPGSLRH